MWLQVNQQTLEKGQNFTDLKNTLHLEENINDYILTELLIWDADNRIKHLGEKQTLAEICCCYWIKKDKSFVKKIFDSCLICRKVNSSPYSCPNLESIKLACYIAMLFMTLIHWKMIMAIEDDIIYDYFVLYTCASTRGIVLELVADVSSNYFVYRFRKFIVCRGCPGKMLSNNGTIFTSQENQILHQTEILAVNLS